MKGLIQGVVLASAGLLWSATMPLTMELAIDPFTIFLLVVHGIPRLIFWSIPAAILGGYLGSEVGSKPLHPVPLHLVHAF